jgi:CII-binding regulator of phage lambda lysogenization HflD
MTTANYLTGLIAWASKQDGKTGLETLLEPISNGSIITMSNRAKHELIQSLILMAPKYDAIRHAGNFVGSMIRCLARALRHAHFAPPKLQ